MAESRVQSHTADIAPTGLSGLIALLSRSVDSSGLEMISGLTSRLLSRQSSGTAKAHLLSSSREKAVGASRVRSSWCRVLGSTLGTLLRELARVTRCQDHILAPYPGPKGT